MHQLRGRVALPRHGIRRHGLHERLEVLRGKRKPHGREAVLQLIPAPRPEHRNNVLATQAIATWDLGAPIFWAAARSRSTSARFLCRFSPWKRGARPRKSLCTALSADQ
jgi:hypothetical protein